ncbi:hypothetical protein AB7942_30080 [Neobacillus sp. BF23-41]
MRSIQSKIIELLLTKRSNKESFKNEKLFNEFMEQKRIEQFF